MVLMVAGAMMAAGAISGLAGKSKRKRAARKRRAALFALAQQLGTVPNTTARAGDRELRFGKEGIDASDFFPGGRQVEEDQLAILRAQAAPQLARDRASALGETIDTGTTGLQTGNLFVNPVLQAQAASAQQSDLGFQREAFTRGLAERNQQGREFQALFGAEMKMRSSRFRRQRLAAEVQGGAIGSKTGTDIDADFFSGLGSGLFSSGVGLFSGGGGNLFSGGVGVSK